MKVTVVVLVTWTAISMATATPVPIDAALSAFNATTSTASRTPISGLSANMTTVDITEERVIDVPPEITNMLARLHAELIGDLPAYMQPAKMNELKHRIHDMRQMFSRLTGATNHGNIFENPYFLQWTESVRQSYADSPETADKAMLGMLAIHFGSDDNLVRALIAAIKIDTTKDVADKLLDAQLDMWANDGKNVEDIFELLKLHLIPFERPLFQKYFAFLKSRYGDNTKAFVAIFPVSAFYLKGDDLTWLLGGLDAYLRVVAKDGNDAETIFKLLRLHLSGDKVVESPLFSKWFEFVRSRYGDDTKSFVAMFPVLAFHLKGNDLTWLLGGLDAYLKVVENDEEDAATIFKLLRLELTGDKVVESPLYSRWFELARSRYGDDTKAFVAMFPVLADHLKGDELAKLLVVGLTLDLTKVSATERLNERAEELVKSWVDNERDASYVFELLELHLTKNYFRQDSQLIKDLIDNGNDLAYVFKHLEADLSESFFREDPRMRTWVEFVKICKSDLNERKMVVMSTLYHYIKKPPNV
ncbi:unnamed protein product [Peronospora farinosa]|uniref:RxLR effector protein n=1 Tax=Peronospora farinosa TaxID=134698 RepID=A0ABN8CIL8_9STRA|nr:unnamed protein product [Peronospora farinosa]